MKPPSTMNTQIDEPEFSCPLSVARIPPSGLVQELLATPDQRAALADRLGLLELKKLQAKLDVHITTGDLIEVTGSLAADVVQQCVVSLEPLPQKVAVKIDAIFAPASYEANGEGMTDLSMLERDVDYIQNGVIDLGELVTQNLGIALDPYPRKKGLEPLGDDQAVPESRPNPFAELTKTVLTKPGKNKDNS